MLSESPLRIAVIGSGYWGKNYVRLFSELATTEVVAVCDQDRIQLQKVAERMPGVMLTTRVQDVLESDNVDAVVVATPATQHYEVTLQCLQANKHVLLEKPMTIYEEEARHLIAVADARQLILMVGHIYLYNSAIQRLKTYIDSGAMGELYYLYSQRTNLGPIRHDVNALWDLAPHDISIMNHLMGTDPLWVSAVGHKALRNGREDVGFIVLGYPNDVIGQLHVSWVDPDKVRQVVAVGSQMRIICNDLNPQEPLRIYEKGVVPVDEPDTSDYAKHQFTIRNGDIISPNVTISEPLRNQCLHFVDCVQRGVRPISDGHNGLSVVSVMQAIARSVSQYGTPVEVQGEHNERRAVEGHVSSVR